jgi:hypothetical protein
VTVVSCGEFRDRLLGFQLESLKGTDDREVPRRSGKKGEGHADAIRG